MIPGRLAQALIRQRRSALGPVWRQLLLLQQIDIPRAVEIGDDLEIVHRGQGITINAAAVIGSRVQIFPRVTIGRSDVYRSGRVKSLTVEDDCVLATGAAILCGGGKELTVAQGCIVGANAVLTRSTRPWEIWAGNPAQKVGERDPHQ